MKTCRGCKIEADDHLFVKNSNWCKKCQSIYKKKYKQDNKETITKQNSEYYQNNKEEILEYQKQHYGENKKEILFSHAKYRENNKEKITEQNAKYYQENKEKISIKASNYRKNNKLKMAQMEAKYRKNNKEKITKRKSKYEKERIKNDPIFRLRKFCSISIRASLKLNGESKNRQSILEYLPYTIEELKLHIEALFFHPDNLTPDGKVWMNWQNQGAYIIEKWNDNDPATWKWQLDHIIPHSTFKYINMEDQIFRECWALSNLRPLSAKQNQLDGATRIRHQ